MVNVFGLFFTTVGQFSIKIYDQLLFTINTWDVFNHFFVLNKLGKIFNLKFDSDYHINNLISYPKPVLVTY